MWLRHTDSKLSMPPGGGNGIRAAQLDQPQHQRDQNRAGRQQRGAGQRRDLGRTRTAALRTDGGQQANRLAALAALSAFGRLEARPLDASPPDADGQLSTLRSPGKDVACPLLRCGRHWLVPSVGGSEVSQSTSPSAKRSVACRHESRSTRLELRIVGGSGIPFVRDNSVPSLVPLMQGRLSLLTCGGQQLCHTSLTRDMTQGEASGRWEPSLPTGTIWHLTS